MVAEKFEGNPPRYNFTQLEWSLIRNSQKIRLVYCFDDSPRRVWITKKLRKPLQHMADTVNRYLNRTNSADDLKYMIHSSHDTQVWNVVTYLNPVDYDPLDVQYASTINFELHYDDNCLANTKIRGPNCFSVHVMINGVLLKLPTCLADNNMSTDRIGSPICTYTSFMKHVQSLAQPGDLDS